MMARFQWGDMRRGEGGKDGESDELTFIEGIPDSSMDAGRNTIVVGCRSNRELEDSALQDFFRDILTEQDDGNWRTGRYNAVKKFIITRASRRELGAEPLLQAEVTSSLGFVLLLEEMLFHNGTSRL